MSVLAWSVAVWGAHRYTLFWLIACCRWARGAAANWIPESDREKRSHRGIPAYGKREITGQSSSRNSQPGRSRAADQPRPGNSASAADQPNSQAGRRRPWRLPNWGHSQFWGRGIARDEAASQRGGSGGQAVLFGRLNRLIQERLLISVLKHFCSLCLKRFASFCQMVSFSPFLPIFGSTIKPMQFLNEEVQGNDSKSFEAD